MNRKALGAAIIGMGLLCIVLGLYQANQYMVSSATSSATIKSMGALGAEADTYATQLATSMAEVSGALMQVIFIDFALGIVLVLAGLFVYPDK